MSDSDTKANRSKKSKNEQPLKSGVKALIHSTHDTKVSVAAVVLRTEVDDRNNRWYHLVHAAPGSIFAIAGVSEGATISEKDLLAKSLPERHAPNSISAYLWDHLRMHGFEEAMKASPQPA